MIKNISLLEAAVLLKENDRYLILTHLRPDGDTTGSAGALCQALRFLKKEVYLLENPEIGKRYASMNVPFYAPQGYEPDFVISTDMADMPLLPKNAKMYGDRIWLNLDHHGSNPGIGTYNIIEPDTAACGEIIYELILALGVPFTKELAYPVYVSISTDTGCFRYSNTRAHTHMVAAACLKAGIDGGEINRRLFEVKSKPRYEMECYITGAMEFYHDGRIAIVLLPRNIIDKTQADLDDLDNIASVPRTIEGVECGITIQENADGSIKVSVRTTKEADASALCAKCGGGGHARAAGATFHHSNLAEVKAKILKAAEEIMQIGK